MHSIDHPLITKSFQTNGFVLFRKFINTPTVKKYLASISAFPEKRVTCGIKDVEWGEQHIPADNIIYKAFISDFALNIIKSCIGLTKDQFINLSCWTSVYSMNEYINPHKDRSGTIQAILCLKNPDPRLGGWLGLNMEDGCNMIYLNQGDLIIFKASEVEHFTTPIIKNTKHSFSRRIVAVARYFYNKSEYYD